MTGWRLYRLRSRLATSESPGPFERTLIVLRRIYEWLEVFPLLWQLGFAMFALLVSFLLLDLLRDLRWWVENRVSGAQVPNDPDEPDSVLLRGRGALGGPLVRFRSLRRKFLRPTRLEKRP